MFHLQANAENKTGRTPLPKTEGMEERVAVVEDERTTKIGSNG